MGDENTVLGVAGARHLLRRAGFGAAQLDVERLKTVTRGQAADELLAFPKKAFKPSGRYIEDSHNKWIKFLVKTKAPLQSKLVLFWHDHFATSNTKIEHPKLMANQIKLFYGMCAGNLKNFVKAMNKDAAMMEFLDTVRNHADVPNENYARELQELFTLGVYDFSGAPNYTQQDIVQIARAFTGWDYEYNNGRAFFRDDDHDKSADFPERGDKRIYESTGNIFTPGMPPVAGKRFDAGGEGPQEIDAVIDIIFEHTDSDTKNTVARRTARRLFEYFAHAIPNPISPSDIAVIDAIVTDSQFDTTWNIGALVRAIFVSDAFYESAEAAPFAASTKKSVKWPIDYVVSTLRLLGMKLKGKYQYVDGGDYRDIRSQLSNMGQVLLEPPSVFGWDWENAWLSSATLLARYNFARDLTSARGGGSSAFRPSKVGLEYADAETMVTAVTDLLGVSDQLTQNEHDYLVAYANDVPPMEVPDPTIKLNGIVALVLQSPAYQLH